MDEFYVKYKNKIAENSDLSANGHCAMWTKAKKPSGYGIIKYKNPHDNAWRTMHVHRLSFLVNRRIELNDLQGYDISHLCHNKLCTNAQHLSLETHKINRDREICVNRTVCTGHDNFENCRLHLKL